MQAGLPLSGTCTVFGKAFTQPSCLFALLCAPDCPPFAWPSMRFALRGSRALHKTLRRCLAALAAAAGLVGPAAISTAVVSAQGPAARQRVSDAADSPKVALTTRPAARPLVRACDTAAATTKGCDRARLRNPNAACNAAGQSACWDHRTNLLSPWAGSMGAAVTKGPEGRLAVAELMVANP